MGSEPAAVPRDEDGYVTCVYPPLHPQAFRAGEAVFAQLRVGVGGQGWAHATVAEYRPGEGGGGAGGACVLRVEGRAAGAEAEVVPVAQLNGNGKVCIG